MTGDRKVVRLIRVFVSSPGDVAEEREVLEEVVRRINDIDGQEQGVRLELFRWETDVVPCIGPSPQENVDAQTPRFDIYLGIMSTRFGTPTGEHGSGTEKEFRDAVDRWGRTGKPWILFYFDEDPPLPRSTDAIEQYLAVRKFHDELLAMGIIGTFKGVRGSSNGFFEQVDRHLRRILHMWAQGEQETPAPAPDLKPVVPQAYRDWLRARCTEIGCGSIERRPEK